MVPRCLTANFWQKKIIGILQQHSMDADGSLEDGLAAKVLLGLLLHHTNLYRPIENVRSTDYEAKRYIKRDMKRIERIIDTGTVAPVSWKVVRKEFEGHLRRFMHRPVTVDFFFCDNADERIYFSEKNLTWILQSSMGNSWCMLLFHQVIFARRCMIWL